MFNVKNNQITNQIFERKNYSKDSDTPRIHIKNTRDIRIFSKRVRFYSQPVDAELLNHGGLSSILEFPFFLPLQRTFCFTLKFRSQFLPWLICKPELYDFPGSICFNEAISQLTRLWLAQIWFWEHTKPVHNQMQVAIAVFRSLLNRMKECTWWIPRALGKTWHLGIGSARTSGQHCCF